MSNASCWLEWQAQSVDNQKENKQTRYETHKTLNIRQSCCYVVFVPISVVAVRWARLVPGWVTISGRVNYVCTWPATQVNSNCPLFLVRQMDELMGGTYALINSVVGWFFRSFVHCPFVTCSLGIINNIWWTELSASWLYLCSVLHVTRTTLTTGWTTAHSVSTPTTSQRSRLLTVLRFTAVQKFWKSVKIWQSYRKFKGENFFWDTV